MSPFAVPTDSRVILPVKHPTSVAFFDEAGAISSDRFFVVGLLKVEDHAKLLKRVKVLRKKYKMWDEFKWSSVTAANEPAYRDLIQLLVESEARFSCFVADRHVADPVARFGNTFRAYEKLSTQLLIGSVRPYELMTVLADRYSAPDARSFETVVRKECNERLRRLAVVAVIQMDSAATEGLQLVDVLTGAVAFGFKADAGVAKHSSMKGRLAGHLRDLVGVPNFNAGYFGGNFSVCIYEHTSWLIRQQTTLGVLSAGPQVRAPRIRHRTRGGQG